MFSGIGFSELLIILVIALILFGGRKIPQLAKDLGQGIKEFRRSLMMDNNEEQENDNNKKNISNNIYQKEVKSISRNNYNF